MILDEPTLYSAFSLSPPAFSPSCLLFNHDITSLSERTRHPLVLLLIELTNPSVNYHGLLFHPRNHEEHSVYCRERFGFAVYLRKLDAHAGAWAVLVFWLGGNVEKRDDDGMGRVLQFYV